MNTLSYSSRSLKVQLFSFVLIFCLSLSSVFGQTDTTKKVKTKPFIGLEFTATRASYLNMLDYSGYITVTNNRSYFALGPVIGKERMVYPRGWGNGYASVEMDNNSLNGFNFIYQVNPNQRAKVFDFFFQYKFNLLSFNNEKIKEPINSEYTSGYFSNNKYNSLKLRVIQNYIGYGLKLKILNNFYFTQSVNVGWMNTKTTYDSEMDDLAKMGSFSESSMDIMVNFGMGYNFQKRNKTK